MSALADMLEEIKADRKIAAAAASDPAWAGHLAKVEQLFTNLMNNDGAAIELHDQAVRIITRPVPLRERVTALHHYLAGLPDRQLIAAGLVPPPADVRPGRLQ